MNANNVKMALYRVLLDLEVPLGIHDLISHLPDQSAERSVRRWLDELIQAKLIDKTGQKRSTRYFIPIPTRFAEEREQCFSTASLSVLAKPRKPVSYNDSWLEAYKPNRTFYLPLETRIDLFKNGKRVRESEAAGTYVHRIFNRLLIDLSYNSSRLEGNTYSLLDTQKLLLNGIAPEGKTDEEKIMILNHKEAIRYLVDSAPKLQISSTTICTLHSLLSDMLVEPDYVGKVRDHAVRIGGSVYLPYSNPLKLKNSLELITKKAALINDPFEQSFFLLVHLSYLQAFTDVNKRTARLSANIPLIKNNLVPLSFCDVDRNDYISAMLAVYELQAIQPLIDVYRYSYIRTCTQYDSTVQSFDIDVLSARYRPERRRIISNIIQKKIAGASMDRHIQAQAKKLIPEKDRFVFIEKVKDELARVDETRIYGLGVTPAEFQIWKKVNG